MLKIIVRGLRPIPPPLGGANIVLQTTQLNFRKRFMYVRSTKISLFTSVSVINVDAYPFLAFSDLNCHYVSTGIFEWHIFWVHCAT